MPRLLSLRIDSVVCFKDVDAHSLVSILTKIIFQITGNHWKTLGEVSQNCVILPEIGNWRCVLWTLQKKLCSWSLQLKDGMNENFQWSKLTPVINEGSIDKFLVIKMFVLGRGFTSSDDTFVAGQGTQKWLQAKADAQQIHYGWVVWEKENARPPSTVHETFMFLMLVKWTWSFRFTKESVLILGWHHFTSCICCDLRWLRSWKGLHFRQFMWRWNTRI